MTYKKLIFILILIFAVGGGFWVYKQKENRTLLRLPLRQGYAGQEDFAGQANASNKTDAVSALSSESEIYNNPDHNFSLQLLPGLSTNAFEEGDGDVVLIQLDKSYMSNESYKSYSAFQMQITIRPFDEETSLTAARIQKEVPEIKMQNVVAVKADGTDAVSFVSCSPSSPSEERMPAGQERLNCFREIWFVQNRELYQIIAPSSFDNVTGKLMESWKWE